MTNRTPLMTPAQVEADKTLDPMRSLIAAGFDPAQIRIQAESHLAALRRLPNETELKAEAIEATECFIEALK